MKYLITNADDYGYRSDISHAIVDSHQNGILTSTTVLVNFVSPEDVALVNSVPTLALGLHLNLTSGEPVSSHWKQKYGDFSRPNRGQPNEFDREEWITKFDRFSTEDVITEYEAQLQLFRSYFHKLPSHIDSHHYSASYTTTFPAYREIARKYGLAIRQPVTFAPRILQKPGGEIIDMPDQAKIIKAENIRTTNKFSLCYLNRHTNYLEVLIEELSSIQDNQSIEISFHPGYDEQWRNKDLEILKDTRVRDFIEVNDVSLVTYFDM